jgi:hypothetical protein
LEPSHFPQRRLISSPRRLRLASVDICSPLIDKSQVLWLAALSLGGQDRGPKIFRISAPSELAASLDADRNRALEGAKGMPPQPMRVLRGV